MAGADILVGIDGTHTNPLGDMGPDEYDRAFSASHVRHIVNHSRFGKQSSYYIRGPAGAGTYVNRCFEEALDAIEAHVAAHPQGPIRLHLTGFSRGAAIALDLGNELAQPPQGVLSDLARVFTLGKTVEVVGRLASLRRRVAGRLSVPVLALFDPVDMSTDIDGSMISRHVGASALVRRSVGWGSRLGWSNVGDEAEPGSTGIRAHRILDGTHGAMGGMPFGDLPKALARDLLKQLVFDAQWNVVERRYRGKPLEATLVKAALNAPGLFVHPRTGGFLGAAANLSVRLLKEFSKEVADAAIVQTYRRMLKKYADENGAMAGTVSMALDAALGSFKGIDTYFSDFSDCTNLISGYKMKDEAAGRAARNWMSMALGNAYPATS
jgi:hypothetical protein